MNMTPIGVPLQHKQNATVTLTVKFSSNTTRKAAVFRAHFRPPYSVWKYGRISSGRFTAHPVRGNAEGRGQRLARLPRTPFVPASGLPATRLEYRSRRQH